jgi:transketolase
MEQAWHAVIEMAEKPGARELSLIANTMRQHVIRMLLSAKSGHSAGPLGMADIFAAMYFSVLNHDPKKPDWDARDRLILSNGHICPILYAALAEAGYFPREELLTLRKLGSRLQGHQHPGELPGIENAGGPLGQGLGISCGIASALRLDNNPARIYCLCSDGEHGEGATWEAAMFAAKYKLSNLIAIMDRNFIQIDGTTEGVMPLEPLAEKYRAFGWSTLEVDGHDIPAFLLAIEKAKANKAGPTMIIAKTTPGKGVSFMEGKYEWHGKAPNEEEAKSALAQLEAARKKLEG